MGRKEDYFPLVNRQTIAFAKGVLNERDLTDDYVAISETIVKDSICRFGDDMGHRCGA